MATAADFRTVRLFMKIANNEIDHNNKHKEWYVYLFPLAALAGFTAALWPHIHSMIQQWGSEDNSYGYIVVPLFLYLCWDMRERFDFKTFSWSLWGVLPALLGIFLMIVGELSSVITLIFAGIWIALASGVVSLYGSRAIQLRFPLFILGFIVVLPPFIKNMLTFQLKLAASHLSVAMMRLVGISVVLTGNIIDLGVQQLQVVDACSGLRYFVSLILMALLIGYFFSRGWWRQTLLVILVLPLSIFVNAFRIFVSGILTVNGYQELADSFFHDFSGMVIFLMAGAILVGLALLLRRIGKKFAETPFNQTISAGSKHPKPLAITLLLCVVFITGGLGLRILPAMNHTPVRTSFSEFPAQIGKWQGQRQYLSKEIMASLWADDYVSANYRHPEIANTVHLFIPFYAYQATEHTAHAPQACMLGSGWSLKDPADITIQVAGGKSVRLRTMIWENRGARLLGSYFFLMRGRVLTNPWINKLYLMWDAFTQRRTDGALIRIEIRMGPGQDRHAVQQILAGFLNDLWPMLPAYVPE
jgi:exosortase D (VPLPA-CTERM-specific)